MFKRLFKSLHNPPLLHTTGVFSRRRTWLKIFFLGLSIAVLVSIWPEARCALGACGERDEWCGVDCSKSCSATTGLGIVTACGTYNPIGGYCPESGWEPNSVEASCSSSANCRVTGVDRYASRLSTRNGRSYWSAGGCVYDPAAAGSCRLDDRENTGQVDCCSGSSGPGGSGPGGSGGPPACTPTYAAPTITLAGYSPAYPLVFSQDPDRLGTTVTILAAGGEVTNGCSQGARNPNITTLTLDGVKLSAASTGWIQSYLAQRYPGARVKGSYPFVPDVAASGIGATSATLTFTYEPADPGYYEIQVTAAQSDGQTASATLSVPAFLLDATISLPQP